MSPQNLRQCAITQKTQQMIRSQHTYTSVLKRHWLTIIKRVSIVYGYKHQKIYETYKIICCVSPLWKKCKPSKIGEKSNNDVVCFLGVQSVRFCRRRFGKGEKKERGEVKVRDRLLWHYSFSRGVLRTFRVYVNRSFLNNSLSLFTHSV